jgi:hypothetical protein
MPKNGADAAREKLPAELTPDDGPKLISRVVGKALGITNPEKLLPKDVLELAIKQMPDVDVGKLAPKAALLVIASAIAERKAAKAARERAKRMAKQQQQQQRRQLPQPAPQPELVGGGDDEDGAEPVFTTDSHGNTVRVAEVKRLRAEQAEREAAAARRAARAAGGDGGAPSSSTTPSSGGGDDGSSLQARAAAAKAKDAEALAVARGKAKAGAKLSGKERKLIKKWGLEDRPSTPEEEGQGGQQGEKGELEALHEALRGFTLSVRVGGVAGSVVGERGEQEQEGDGGGEGEGEASRVGGGRDIVVGDFSIGAPGASSRELFVGAALHLRAGRRYALLGANGGGKTTLLRFLAARRLPLPPRTSVLLVQQEVAASAAPVWEQVLTAWPA